MSRRCKRVAAMGVAMMVPCADDLANLQRVFQLIKPPPKELSRLTGREREGCLRVGRIVAEDRAGSPSSALSPHNPSHVSLTVLAGGGIGSAPIEYYYYREHSFLTSLVPVHPRKSSSITSVFVRF